MRDECIYYIYMLYVYYNVLYHFIYLLSGDEVVGRMNGDTRIPRVAKRQKPKRSDPRPARQLKEIRLGDDLTRLKVESFSSYYTHIESTDDDTDNK